MQIQRISRGLLSFFGSKGSGDNPPFALDSVTPATETEGFYNADSLEVVSNNVAGLSLQNTGSDIVVPSGQVWRVLSLSARLEGMASGVEGGVVVGLLSPQGSNICPINWSGLRTSTQATSSMVACDDLGFHCVIGPGCAIVGRLTQNISAGTVNVFTTALIRRLEI